MKVDKNEIKYPIGVQDFEKLIEGGYVYVDKSAFVYDIVKNGGYYFLSRPRRFGKSLFLSTLEAYYRGCRHLFKGLALDTLTDRWESRPVLHLDFNNGNYESEERLLEKLDFQLTEWERSFDVASENKDFKQLSPSLRFGRLIKDISEKTGKRIVILVDEYDKPLLHAIDHPELADKYRFILKLFYSNFKTMDRHIELAFLTGVARFSKVSIFSDLNNLRDISFEDNFASVCGISENELQEYFQVGIRELGGHLNESYDNVIALLRKHYDGYHFSKKSPDIFNPFSLLNSFIKNELGSYWFESGTPTYLVNLVRRMNLPFKNISPSEIDRNVLETAGLMESDAVPSFYQAGYLTIKDYDRDTNCYILDYPNEEVKEGFLKFLLQSYVPDMQTGSGFIMADFIKAVRNGNAERFMSSLQSLVAGVPYSEKGSAEGHFQNIVYLLFTLLGFFARMEHRTSDGRIDLTVETSDYVYIFEFKVNSHLNEAMAQIKRKKYWLPYLSSGKDIFLIGANFDTATRRLSGWEIEKVL